MAAHANNHDYHLVDPSPWPFIGSISAFTMALGGIMYMRYSSGNSFEVFGADIANPWVFYIGLIGVLYTFYAWWADVIKEANGSDHTPVVMMHHRYGMMLFIASEIMFFVAWFWAYFDGFLRADDVEQFTRLAFTGGVWPPVGTEIFDPWHLPLFNTLILLTSGTTVTWAHHALLQDDREGLKWGLILTALLGALFTAVQLMEYASAGFTFQNSIYGATFFMATGFHGFHVLVGTIFLIVCLVRVNSGHFTAKQHLGFEFAAWYWHFVDVVWLFLFATIYVWGSWGVTIIHH